MSWSKMFGAQSLKSETVNIFFVSSKNSFDDMPRSLYLSTKVI